MFGGFAIGLLDHTLAIRRIERVVLSYNDNHITILSKQLMKEIIYNVDKIFYPKSRFGLTTNWLYDYKYKKLISEYLKTHNTYQYLV